MFKITEEQIVRIMIYEIRDKCPDAVKFVVTPDIVKNVYFYLETKKYDTLMYLYSHKFLIEILKMYQEYENYEVCEEIVKQIQKHNDYYQDNLSTK